ncbi:alkaline phosphatase, partial [Rhizobium ruizarguesonis]
LVVANEGDYQGGSRGFTIFDKTCKLLYESGASFERSVAHVGHYPESRSGSKGVEPEGAVGGSRDAFDVELLGRGAVTLDDEGVGDDGRLLAGIDRVDRR